MSTPDVLILADDLTGAAEMAALGKACGHETLLVTSPSAHRDRATVVSYAVDTRLLPPGEAATRLRSALPQLGLTPPPLRFRKIDSVLRGNVLAEARVLADYWGYRRTLIVPSNPSLGRTLVEGQILLHGTPLASTAMAADVHHPAASSSAQALLQARSPGHWVEVLRPGDSLPKAGVFLGVVATTRDVEHWAAQVDDTTLVCGAADFLQALLARTLPTASPQSPLTPPPGPALLLSGTLGSPLLNLPTPASNVWQVLSLPAAACNEPQVAKQWIQQVSAAARQGTSLRLAAPQVRRENEEAAKPIRILLVQAFQAARVQHSFSHWLIEGGATAADLFQSLGLQHFLVAGAWAPGVIALRPTAPHLPLLTVKPGSYRWPETLLASLALSHV